MKKGLLAVVGIFVGLVVIGALSDDTTRDTTGEMLIGARAGGESLNKRSDVPKLTPYDEFAATASKVARDFEAISRCSEGSECQRESLQTACFTLRDLDDKAFLAESVIGQQASASVHEASANCDLASLYLDRGDTASAIGHITLMNAHVIEATAGLRGR